MAQRRDRAKLSARAQRDLKLKPEIARIFASFAVYGARKVWRQMRREGFAVARCTVERLMNEMGLQGVIRGQATASPKSGDSLVEMIRHLKVARDTAVKARTQAMQTMKAVIVSAPDALREDLDQVAGKMAFVRRLAGLRAGPITTTTASAKASLLRSRAGG